eukprot:5130806-Pleurochrysis_carterae.AAC.1
MLLAFVASACEAASFTHTAKKTRSYRRDSNGKGALLSSTRADGRVRLRDRMYIEACPHEKGGQQYALRVVEGKRK